MYGFDFLHLTFELIKNPLEKNQKEKEEKISILGVNIFPLTKKELLKKVMYFLKDGHQHYIVTTNSEFLVTALLDKEFRKVINLADLSVADGNGVIWASYFLNLPVSVSKTFPAKKQRIYRRRKIRNQLLFSLALNLFGLKRLRNIIPERLSGSDLILDICKLLSENDLSLYLLGGEKQTPVAAKFELEKKIPDLIISGIKGGFSKEKIDDEALVEAVNKAKPDVLFVALGHPFQEKWIFKNLDKMPSVKLAMGIGGSLDFLSGKRRRAPEWMMKNTNLEWFFRLIQEPKRYGRIKKAVWDFPKIVYKHKLVEVERKIQKKNNQKN